jgi:syntenin-1
MALYPSLEDKNVDQIVRAEVATAQVAGALRSAPVAALTAGGGAGGSTAAAGSPYAGLMAEMSEFDSAFGGLAIDQAALALHMPEDHISSWMASYNANAKAQPLATVTPASDQGIMRAAIRQGVREVVLAKDQAGYLGVAVDAWDKGVFVAFVWKDSAAALGGLRFGDQIVEINGSTVAGWTAKKTLKFLRDAEGSRVQIAVRDRPFMRTITCQKDSTNHCGFMFKDGEINAIVQDSSAARNGLMIHHQIVEVNGQSVVGLKDKELLVVVQQSPMTTTVTITPRFVYKHLIKKIGWKRIKGFMDHSIPMDI